MRKEEWLGMQASLVRDESEYADSGGNEAGVLIQQQASEKGVGEWVAVYVYGVRYE